MITIKKDLGGKFATRAEAVLALQQLQFVFAMGEFPIVTSYMNAYTLELEVHFENKMPQLLPGYKASSSEVRSYDREDGRLRCKTFYFCYSKE